TAVRPTGRRAKAGRRTATVAAYQRRCVAASVSSMSASETGQRAASRWYPKKGVGGIERRSLLLAADHPTAQGSAWQQTHSDRRSSRQMSFDDKRRSGWRADLTVRFGLRNLK